MSVPRSMISTQVHAGVLPSAEPAADKHDAGDVVAASATSSHAADAGRELLAMLHRGSIVNVDQAEPQPLSTMYVVLYERCRYCTLAVATRAPYSACRWRRR